MCFEQRLQINAFGDAFLRIWEAKFVQNAQTANHATPNHKINISWKFQSNLTSFDRVIAKNPHFWANWASFGHAQGAIVAQNVTMLHNSPRNNKMNISRKFQPNLTSFDRIAKTPIFEQMGHVLGIPKGQNLPKMSRCYIIHIVIINWTFPESFSQIWLVLTELLPKTLIF